MRVSIVLTLALSLGGSTARAQDAGDSAQTGESAEAPDSAESAARAEFEAGRDAFDQGEYERALDYWRRSYDISHAPELLYNMGTALDRLRRNGEAIDIFSRYLEERADAPNRAEVEARLEVLREAQAEPEPEPPPTTGPRSIVGPLVLIVTGGAAAIAGGVLIGIALADKSTVENAPPGARWDDYMGERDRVGTFSTVGAILLGVGAAAAVTGIIWIAIGGDDAEVAALPGGVSVRGRF